MDRSRRRSASLPSIEDPRDDTDGNDTDNRQHHVARDSGHIQRHVASDSGHRQNRAASGISNSLRLPPLYPCNEVCSHCGKKMMDRNGNDDSQVSVESYTDCPCECHTQAFAPSKKVSTLQVHIPPGEPNCLPGCGYTGLPCYHCSSLTNHQELSDSSAQPVSQGFPTQVFPEELLDPAPDYTITVQGEETSNAGRQKKSCIYLVAFVIIIKIAILVFRLLL